MRVTMTFLGIIRDKVGQKESPTSSCRKGRVLTI